MSKFISDARLAVIYWRLSIARVLLYSMSTLIASFMTSNAIVSWPSLSWFERFLVCLGAFSSWSTTMVAFLDKSIGNIASGKEPFTPAQNGNTEILTKTETSVKTDITK